MKIGARIWSIALLLGLAGAACMSMRGPRADDNMSGAFDSSIAENARRLMDEGRTNVTIGRAEENDIVIKGNLISRLHARLELNRNKILLIDQSTNGTFVTTREGEEAFVRRDSMQLKGEGLIGFGRVPESGSSLTVKFVCEE